MTTSMIIIQKSLMQIAHACVNELKVSNKVELSNSWSDNAIGKNFDTQIRKELGPYWHKLSSKGKQLVADLATIRRTLIYLFMYDCVAFYQFLMTVRSEARE